MKMVKQKIIPNKEKNKLQLHQLSLLRIRVGILVEIQQKNKQLQTLKKTIYSIKRIMGLMMNEPNAKKQLKK